MSNETPKDFTYLKAGDAIIYDNGIRYARCLEKHTVLKVTATQIVLDGDRRFNRTDGRRKGTDCRYSFPRLRHVTLELMESIERISIVNQLRNHKWSDTSLGVLRDIQVMLRKEANAKGQP
jgi:hypothetical protein